MNIELFEKVKGLMEQNPNLVNMDTWYRPTDCGTTACIAGWALIAVGEDLAYENTQKVGRVAEVASELLGTPSIHLFYHENWPDDLFNELIEAYNQDLYTEVCCKAIDRYISDPGSFRSHYEY